MAKLVGTAGHVDHGKTSLIRALTGIDADRLPEERSRGMTIDIGFAYMDLPDVGRVSVVDVPGHEKFISNMLVGAQGIDVALLCVAADAGVMPQTREHVQILELLPVQRLIVALTRSDLVDAETLELAKLDVDELLSKTRFSGAPMVAVSSVTGEGLDDLRAALVAWLREPKPTSKLAWLMPIDRVFSVKGHGVVVTGTLANGSVSVGAEAQIMPGDLRARVRSLHSHEEPMDTAESGRRVAMNLGGVKSEDLMRGMLIGQPGTLFETEMCDAKVQWVEQVKHATRVRVSMGSDEVIGKVYLNDQDPELVQLRFERPTAASLHLPLIIRRYSPPDVLAGGYVTTPLAQKRKRSESVQPINTEADLSSRILEALGAEIGGLDSPTLVRRSGSALEALSPQLDALVKEGKIVGFAGLWFTPQTLSASLDQFTTALAELHSQKPMLPNQPKEWVVKAAGFSWSGKPLDRLLATMHDQGKIVVSGAGVHLPDFRIALNQKQSDLLARVVTCLDAAGVSTPSVTELSALVPAPIQAVEEILRLGIAADLVLRLDENVFYSKAALTTIREGLMARFGTEPFTVADCRDHWQTSRKYVVPLLEYFDGQGFTIRQGDQRVVRNR